MLGLALLTACGSVGGPATPAQSDLGYIVTAKIAQGDTQESVARSYGGEILAWYPELGYAQLKLSTAEHQALSGRGVSVQSTTNSTLITPEASGFNSWAGGWNSWAGGWNSWAGGWNSWAGGNAIPDTPAENDAAFAQIRLQQALAISRNYGAGIKVAVIDTGVDLIHPGLASRLAPASEWRDFVDGDNFPQEVSGGNGFGHGTAVAGVIRQVAPRATILPIRVLGPDGSGSLDNVIRAVNHAVDVGANVINLSLGSDQDTWPMLLAIQNAKSRGVFMVASVGNAAQSSVTFPARYTFWQQADGYMFSVGSVNGNDSRSSFSNFSTDQFYWAPGESIFSFAPGNRVGHATGTSFAAPLLAGAVALALSEFPNPSDRWRMKDVLVASGELFPNNNPLGSTIVARGRLDVERILRKLPGWTEPASYRVGTDFVDNGSFESGSGSKWSWFWNARVSDNKWTHACRGEYGGVANPGGGFGQTINGLQPNTTYVMTAWTRVQNPGESAQIGVKNHGAPERWVTFNNNGWVQQRLEFTTGPSSTTAEIYVWKEGGNGPVFADMITMLNK